MDHLAHVGRAEIAAMGRDIKVMIRADSQPPFLVHVPRVRIDLREVGHQTVVLQNGLDEESIGIAHYPQIAPEKLNRELTIRTPKGRKHQNKQIKRRTYPRE